MLTAKKIKRSKIRQWLTNPIIQAKHYWIKAAKIVRSFYMDSEESDQQKLQGDGIAANSSASGIYPLSLPLPPDEEIGFRPYPIFSTETMNVRLASHVSVLTKGSRPHPPHTHDEEEILVLLAGEVDLILPDLQSADDGNRVINPGYFHRDKQSPGLFVAEISLTCKTSFPILHCTKRKSLSINSFGTARSS